MSDEPSFPVPAPDMDSPVSDGRKKREWTAEQRAEFGRRMAEGRARKRAERGGSSAASSKTKSPKTPRSARQPTPTTELEQIETSLLEGLTKFGSAITPVAPIPGVYTIQNAESVSGALTRLAAKNPALLKALSGSSTVMDYVAVGVFGVGLVVAIQVQTGRISADSVAARNFGLTDIALEFYPTLAQAPIEVTEVDEGSGAFAPFEVPVPPDIAQAEARAGV